MSKRKVLPGGTHASKPKSKRERPQKADRAKRPPTIQISGSRCPKCHSTERTEYYGTIRRPLVGIDSLGRAYTHVIWRRTKCLSCGQFRIDKTYENHAAP